MNQGNVESSVSMGPYSGTDTTNPLDTDFAIRNTGGFTITNLTAVGVIVRAGSPRSNITNFEMPRNTFKKLEPGEEAVIASGFYNFIRGTVDFGEIEFLVSFEDVRHPEYRISRKFRFWLKNSPQGPRWLAINPNQKLS